MKKTYIAPAVNLEEVEVEFMLQAISSPVINGGSHDHAPNCQCPLCLGEDDETAAAKQFGNFIWEEEP